MHIIAHSPPRLHHTHGRAHIGVDDDGVKGKGSEGACKGSMQTFSRISDVTFMTGIGAFGSASSRSAQEMSAHFRDSRGACCFSIGTERCLADSPSKRLPKVTLILACLRGISMILSSEALTRTITSSAAAAAASAILCLRGLGKGLEESLRRAGHGVQSVHTLDSAGFRPPLLPPRPEREVGANEFGTSAEKLWFAWK